MNQATRVAILSNFRSVNLVIPMREQDDLTDSADWSIAEARRLFPRDEIFFFNGGDRTKDNIPETAIANKLDVRLVFGVGGENKANSSSDILRNWESD